MEENNPKEINLLQLLNLFFNWIIVSFKKLFVFTGHLFQLSYRHKIITCTLLIISLSISFYMTRSSARIYKAESILLLYGPDAQTAKEVCKQLEFSVSTYKFNSLSAKLLLPDSITKNIISIRSFDVIDYLKDGTPDKIDFANNHSLTDTLNLKMKDRIYLQIKTKRINQIPKVQEAIVSYFNNNSIMRSEFMIRRNDYNQQVQMCIHEYQRIDSLAKISYFKSTDQQLRFDKDKLLVGEQKKQLFYDDLLRINSVKAYDEMKLANFKNPVDLPSGFIVNPIPENGRLKYALIALILGYLSSLILAAFIENLNKVKGFLENK